MDKKTHLYKRSEGKDFIFSSEKEFPQVTEREQRGGYARFTQMQRDLWLSTAEKVEVAPLEVKKFMEYFRLQVICDRRGFNNEYPSETVKREVTEGVIISECFEVKEILNVAANMVRAFAFFRYPEPDKPQEDDQEELWKEFYEIFYNTKLKYYQAEKLAKERFILSRRTA